MHALQLPDSSQYIVTQRVLWLFARPGKHRFEESPSVCLATTIHQVAATPCRGLDIPGHVDHVVNFDFPYNPVDYLHRTGRTARAGQKGKVTSLVAKGDQVLAGRIDQALQQGLPMDELSADRRSLPPNMR